METRGCTRAYEVPGATAGTPAPGDSPPPPAFLHRLQLFSFGQSTPVAAHPPLEHAAPPASAVVAAAAVARAPAKRPAPTPPRATKAAKTPTPRRAPSAYNLFVADAAKSSGAHSLAAGQAALGAAAARWRALGGAEKARWAAAAATAKAQFDAAHPPKPKRAPSGYALFAGERLATAPGATAVDRMRAVAAAWNALPAPAKAPYLARAAAAK